MAKHKPEVVEQDGVLFVKLAHDIDGNPFLVGQEPLAVKDLWDNMSEYELIKVERMRLNKKEAELKEAHVGLFRKYETFFKQDQNDAKLFFYGIGGLEIEVKKEEKIEVKTRHAPEAPPISVEGQKETEGEKNVKDIAPLKGNNGGRGKNKPASPADVY